MDTIIAYRVNGCKVEIVTNDEGEVTVFDHIDQAVAWAETIALFQSGQVDHQIITLDEL